jgi:hypothetical protein
MNEYSLEYLGYYISPHKTHPSVYIVSTVGKGGKIPNMLSGMYTQRSIAKQDIDLYLNSKPVKDKVNAETISPGGSK